MSDLRKAAAKKKLSAAWQRKEGKSESGGLNRKGVASYRRANPGSKLKMAVTTKPSKLKKGGANGTQDYVVKKGVNKDTIATTRQ